METGMRTKLLFALSVLGVIVGLVSAYLYGQEHKAQPPVFNPAQNPYAQGIYANGIIESYQANGENINLYPEVTGTVVKILVSEGQKVQRGAPLMQLDDSVQRALAEQQKSQAEAALAMLEELKAQPRKESLEVARAQMELAGANLKSAQDQLDKQRRSYELEPRSISKDTLDNAENTVKVAKANLAVAQRQYDLLKAGAWSYDIRNQEKQYLALAKAYTASNNLLAKYTLAAPVDGFVLAINTAVGSYVSPQGVYDAYTQGQSPVIAMGGADDYLAVRCYVDEILLHRCPMVPR
jgi:HlyD family secretion protein